MIFGPWWTFHGTIPVSRTQAYFLHEMVRHDDLPNSYDGQHSDEHNTETRKIKQQHATKCNKKHIVGRTVTLFSTCFDDFWIATDLTILCDHLPWLIFDFRNPPMNGDPHRTRRLLCVGGLRKSRMPWCSCKLPAAILLDRNQRSRSRRRHRSWGAEDCCMWKLRLWGISVCPKMGSLLQCSKIIRGKWWFFLINHGILRLSRILNDFNVVYGDFICACGFHFAVTVSPWP